MSSIAKIDQNDKPTLTAYNEVTLLPEPLLCDPTLNVLYVYVATPDSNTPTTLNKASIDQNDKSTLLAYNETTGQVEAVRCGVNGEILLNVVSIT